jgi:hypothetical protein
MSRTFHNGDRRIRVHGIKKDPPDLRRIARALIAFAQAEAEAEAERQAKAQEPTVSATKPPNTQTSATKKQKANPDATDKDAA